MNEEDQPAPDKPAETLEKPAETPEKPINEALSAEMDALLKSDATSIESVPTPVKQASEAPAAPETPAPAEPPKEPTPTPGAPPMAPQPQSTPKLLSVKEQKNWMTAVSIIIFILSIISSIAIGPVSLLLAYRASPYSWVVSMVYLPYAYVAISFISLISFTLLIIALIKTMKNRPDKLKAISLCTIFSTIVYILPWLAMSGLLHIGVRTFSIISTIINVLSIIFIIIFAKNTHSKIKSNSIKLP